MVRKMASGSSQGSSQVARKGMFGQLFSFFPEAYAELKKVHSPSRQETILITLMVLGMIVIFGVFLGLADMLIGIMMRSILT